jgi:hypothetical protein
MAINKKFDILFETAFAHFSNGGFREGSPIKLKPSFFSSNYFKQHYAGNEEFSEWLKSMVDADKFFFIKRVVGHGAMQNVKDANDNEGAGDVYLILKTDPRVVEYPTEHAEFTVPGDWNVLELVKTGNNLPPVQGYPNKYEKPFGQIKPEEAPEDFGLGNRPTDKSLPKKNKSIPASPAKTRNYAKDVKPYKK